MLMKLVKNNHVCMHSCNLLLSLSLSLTTLTPPPPKAAACNLLQHLAHFLRNPLQEPAVQEEKEKNNYWRPLVRPKGMSSLKHPSQMPLKSFYSQLLKTPKNAGTWAKLRTSLLTASSLYFPRQLALPILTVQCFPQMLTKISWEKNYPNNWQFRHQGYILSSCLINLYAGYIMWNARLDEAQVGIKISGRNVNNLS